MRRNLLPAAIVTLGTALGAAAHGHRDRHEPPPPPPPPRVGAFGVAPGPGYVWTGGYHDLRGGAWVWVAGRWLRPPHPRAVWVPAHWERHGHSYRFHPGRWRR